MKSADTLATLDAERKKNNTTHDRLSDHGLSLDWKYVIDPELYKAHISQQLTDSGFNYLTKADGWDDIWNSCQVNADKGTIDAELRKFVDNTIIKGLLELKHSNFYALHKTGLTDGSSYEAFEQYKFELSNYYHYYDDYWSATESNVEGVSVLEYPIDGARRGIKEDYPDGSLSDSSKAVRQWLREKGVYKFINSDDLNQVVTTRYGGTTILFVSGTEVGLPDDVVLNAVEINELKGYPIPTDAIIEVDDAGEKKKLLVIGSLGSTTSATEEIKQAQSDTCTRVLTNIKGRMNAATPSPISVHTTYIESIILGRLEVNRGTRYTLGVNDIKQHPLLFRINTYDRTYRTMVAYRYNGYRLVQSDLPNNYDIIIADKGVCAVYFFANGWYYPNKIALKSLKDASTENPNKVLGRVIDSIVYITNANKYDAIRDAMSDISSLIFIPDPNNLCLNKIPISLYGGKIRIVKADGTTLNIPATEADVRANQKEILDALIGHNGARYNLSPSVLNNPERFKELLDSGAIEVYIESTERFNTSYTLAIPRTLRREVMNDIVIDGETIVTSMMAEDSDGVSYVLAEDGVSAEPDPKRADMIYVGFISKDYYRYDDSYDIKEYFLDKENGRIIKVRMSSGTYYTTIGSGRVYSSLQTMMQHESDLIAGILFNGYVNDVANGFFNDAEPNEVSEADREAELEFMSKERVTMADILARKKRLERKKNPTLADKLINLNTSDKDGSIVKEFLGLLTSEGIDISEKLKGFSTTGVQRNAFKEMLDRLFC